MISRVIFDAAYTASCFWLLASVPPESMPMEPIKLFSVCAAISMIAGLASLWRTKGQEITARVFVSTTLNMGTCGASLAMLIYSVGHSSENIEWKIIGAVGLFSLGGMSSIDLVVNVSKKAFGGVIGSLIKSSEKKNEQ